MSEKTQEKTGAVQRVRLGCCPMFLITMLLCMATAGAGETGLTIPRTMLKEALARLWDARIIVRLEQDRDPNNIILNVDTKDSRRARQIIARAEAKDRIRDAE